MPYQGRQPGVGVRNRFIFTATSGQTSFSGADSNGLTLKYPDATYTDVYLNGVLLIPVTDYAATTKTSIVLSSGAAASDVVEVVAYDIASIANTVPISGGTFTGPLTVEGNFTADGGTIKLDGNYPVGTGNVALGNTALDSNVSGEYNTAIGDVSLTSNTDGVSNTSVGAFSLEDNIGGDYNTASGALAVRRNTTGNQNTGSGYASLLANTTGSFNSAFGASALQNNTTATYNTAVGYQSLYSNTTAQYNTAIGGAAMQYNTTGGENAALGVGALNANTSGNYNTAVGRSALVANTTASYNTAVGYKAGIGNTTGGANTYIGSFAGESGNGVSNTYIGDSSGWKVTTGAKNTILGRFTGNNDGLDIRTSSNNIVLSDGDGIPRMYIGSTGAATMGGATYDSTKTLKLQNVDQNNAASYAIMAVGRQTGANGRVMIWDLENTSNSGAYFVYAENEVGNVFNVRGTGNVQNQNNSYGSTSDVKLKENIQDASSQWDDIKALQVRKYSFISEGLDAPNQLGVIAQELESSGMSGLVENNADINPHTGEDLGTTTKTVKYSILYMKAVKALQEAMERIETLEAKVTALEAN